MYELGIWEAGLELRAKGRTLFGRFPFDKPATIRDRGTVRKEVFRRGAIGWQLREFEKLQAQLSKDISEAAAEAIREKQMEVHLLRGHSFDQPLASMKAGTFRLVEKPDGLEFEADLPEESKQPTWMVDTRLAVESGLMRGVSPGFKIPPKDVVPDAEALEPEPGNAGVMVRVINQAVLFELSLVSRPVYKGSEVNLRHEDVDPEPRRRRLWL